DQQTLEAAAVSLPLNASDPDGDPLTFVATGLPPGLTLETNAGSVGAPAAGSAGSYDVTVTVSDGGGGSRKVTFVWVVTPPAGTNQPPVCTAAQPRATLLWPPNHQLVPITIVGVNDPDGGQPAIVVTRIL